MRYVHGFCIHDVDDRLAARLLQYSARHEERFVQFRHHPRNDLCRAHWFYFRTRGLSPSGAQEQAAELTALGVSLMSITEQLEYTAAEIDAAPACLLSATATTGTLLPDADLETFDWNSGCPKCWTGATQTGDLTIEGFSPRRGRFIAATWSGHVLIHAELRHMVEPILAGALFRPIRSRRRDADKWFQIVPTLVLPPMHAETRGMVHSESCSACRRDGHYHTPSVAFQPAYVNLNFQGHGCAATHECWGPSRKWQDDKWRFRVAQPALCVPRAVAAAFRTYARRDTALQPVVVSNS